MSPINLPHLLAEMMGAESLADFAALVHEHGPVRFHLSGGMMIRNFLRSKVRGWTDIELDDLWPCVLMSAAGKGGKHGGAIHCAGEAGVR